MSRRARNAFLVLGATALALMAVACGGDDSSDGSTGSSNTAVTKEKVTIGIQDFGESKILAQVYGQALAADGYQVSYKTLGGFRKLVYPAFESGDINFTPEYVASALEFLNEGKGEATSDVTATAEKLRAALAAKSLVAFEPAPAVDTNALVVTRATAEKYSLENISDLAGKDLRLGGPQDCPTNPFCIPGLQKVYGIDMSKGFTPLDGGGPLTKQALEGGSIDVAVLFSTDSSIKAKGWVTLVDDKKLFAADNVVPVLTKKLADAGGEALESRLDGVSSKITTEKLLDMNTRFDVDKDDAEVIAKDFLKSEGLVK